MSQSKKLICIIGMSGSGKTKAKEYLAKKLRIPVIEVSDIVKAYSKNNGTDLIRSPFLLNELIRRVEYLKSSTIVISGIREKFLLDGLKARKFNIISIAIKANPKTRTSRLLKRGMSIEQIKNKTREEIKIGTIGAINDSTYTIHNNGKNINDLYDKLNLLVRNMKISFISGTNHPKFSNLGNYSFCLAHQILENEKKRLERGKIYKQVYTANIEDK